MRDGETILLDAGTTTGRVAAHLVDRSNITVVTNGLTALSELSHAYGVQVVVLGGRLRQLSQGLIGPLTDSSLASITFDRAFLGADGLRADFGICEAEIEQTRTKELMASRAAHVYVVADSSKLGTRPFNAWARAGPVHLGHRRRCLGRGAGAVPPTSGHRGGTCVARLPGGAFPAAARRAGIAVERRCGAAGRDHGSGRPEPAVTRRCLIARRW